MTRIYSTITVAPREFIEEMVKKGLLVIVRQMLACNSEKLFEHVLWTLCNVIGEVAECRMTIYEMGMYDMILERYNQISNKTSINPIFAWFISNSLKDKPHLNDNLVT